MKPGKHPRRVYDPTRTSSKRPRFPWFLLVLGFVTLGVLILLRPDSPGRMQATPPPEPEAPATEDNRSQARTAALPPEGSQKTPADPAVSSAPEPAPSPTPFVPEEPEPEQNARIGHIIDDFRGYSKNLDGYKLDGLVRTNEGIALAPSSDDNTSESDGFRRGVLESPVLPFAHPSNAVQPIWRAKVPDSEASLRVELALSADAQNWSQWYQIEPTGDDISPTYPDGSPNPNYGAVSGGIIANGLSLYPYMRYRVTLASTGEDVTPVLEEFKVTYLDSTLGQGYPADQPPPEEMQADVQSPAPTPLPTPELPSVVPDDGPAIPGPPPGPAPESQ